MAQDPLRLLVKAVSGGNGSIELLAPDRTTTVHELKECGFLSFPSISSAPVILAKDTPTRYKRDESSFYDLASLLFCYLKKEDGAGEYFKAAQEQQVVPAGVMERRAVTELLEGKRPEGDSVVPIDAAAPSGPSAPATAADGQFVRSTTPDEPPPDEEAPTTAERPAKKARYAPSREDQELVKRLLSYQEPKQLADRESVLRGAKPVSFEHLKPLIADRLNSARMEFSKGSAPDRGAPTRGPDRKKRPLQPIIIVSPAASALITMHNAKAFLEDAVFVPSQEAVASGNKVLDDAIAITHRRQIGSKSNQPGAQGTALGQRSAGDPERATRYWIVDSVGALSKFGSSDVWDRVVCVMTTGQEWQFRPYKWSEPKELFHHVKGIHFYRSNEQPHPNVKQWNVTEMKLDPTKRHSDKSLVAEFWRQLELWIASNKPYLQY